MAGIFISYRHKDNPDAAGRLADHLSEVFGPRSIFRDVQSLEPGIPFPEALDNALDSCAALIAVVGPHWVDLANEPREDPTDKDWVRVEIQRALDRGIRTIPVLASIPLPKQAEVPPELRPLFTHQAVELTDRHWKQDVDVLIQALEKIPGIGGYFSLNATVQGFRFYEGGFRAASQKRPKYTEEFHQGAIRWLYWRLILEYPAPKQAIVFTTEASWFGPDGTKEFDQTAEQHVEEGWTGSTHGSGSQLNFAPGVHTVVLSSQGIELARGSFRVLAAQLT